MDSSAEPRLTTSSDRQIVLVRDFAAPRRLVFDAWTSPSCLRWLGRRNG